MPRVLPPRHTTVTCIHDNAAAALASRGAREGVGTPAVALGRCNREHNQTGKCWLMYLSNSDRLWRFFRDCCFAFCVACGTRPFRRRKVCLFEMCKQIYRVIGSQGAECWLHGVACKLGIQLCCYLHNYLDIHIFNFIYRVSSNWGWNYKHVEKQK